MADEQDKRTVTQTFTITGESENESYIRTVLSSMKESQINHHNFRKFSDQWMNTRKIILAQVENEYALYSEASSKYKELRGVPRIQQAIDNGLVPMDLYKLLVEIMNHMKQITSWKFMEAELSQHLSEKMIMALGEANALDIEREVLKRMAETQAAQNKLFEEIMSSRFETMDTKFLSAIKYLQDENRLDRKENINIMANALVTNADIMRDSVSIMIKAMKKNQIDPSDHKKDFEDEFTKIVNSKDKQLSDIQSKKKPDDLLSVIQNDVQNDKIRKQSKRGDVEPIKQKKEEQIPEEFE